MFFSCCISQDPHGILAVLDLIRDAATSSLIVRLCMSKFSLDIDSHAYKFDFSDPTRYNLPLVSSNPSLIIEICSLGDTLRAIITARSSSVLTALFHPPGASISISVFFAALYSAYFRHPIDVISSLHGRRCPVASSTESITLTHQLSSLWEQTASLVAPTIAQTVSGISPSSSANLPPLVPLCINHFHYTLEPAPLLSTLDTLKATALPTTIPPMTAQQSVLDALSISVRLDSFPLALLFSPLLLWKYRQLGRWVLRIRFAQHRLRSCWKSLQYAKSLELSDENDFQELLSPKSLFRRLFALRQSMSHLFDAMLYYLDNNVIERHWRQLFQQLHDKRSLQELAVAHSSTVDRCIHGCLLSSRGAVASTLDLISICEAFCTAVDRVLNLESTTAHDEDTNDEHDRRSMRQVQLDEASASANYAASRREVQSMFQSMATEYRGNMAKFVEQLRKYRTPTADLDLGDSIQFLIDTITR